MLELFIGAIALSGIVAIALERPPKPRPLPLWTDELERRLVQRRHDRS